MPLHLTYDQTPELMYDFMKHFWWRNRRLKIIGVIVLLLVAFAVLAEVAAEGFTAEGLLSWILPLVIVVLIWIALIPALLKRQLRRNTRDSNLGEGREMILSEEGILLKTKASDSSFKWEAIQKVSDSRLSYFLWIARNQAVLIPKDALNDDTEAELLELLKKKGLLN